MKKIVLSIILCACVANGQDVCDSLLQQLNKIISNQTKVTTSKDTVKVDTKYEKVDKILSRSTGAILAMVGVTGMIFTIADASGKGDFDYYGRKIDKWSKLHTCTVTISSGLILSGLLRLAH
jgi:hypothetical protein